MISILSYALIWVSLWVVFVKYLMNFKGCFRSHYVMIQSTIVERSCLFVHSCYIVESVSTSESMIPRPCFQALHTIYSLFCYLFACCHFYFILYLLLIIIHTTCISLSLHRTSAPIHLTSVLGVLGTQETFCIIIAGLLKRDSESAYATMCDFGN
jgi:hypothetical protein